jgi:hypothetical protein
MVESPLAKDKGGRPGFSEEDRGFSFPCASARPVTDSSSTGGSSTLPVKRPVPAPVGRQRPRPFMTTTVQGQSTRTRLPGKD